MVVTLTQQRQLERVQKRACRIILGPAYNTYDDALPTLMLAMRHHDQALRKFGMDLLHHPRHRHLLPPPAAAAPTTTPARVTTTMQAGTATDSYRSVCMARTDRYKKSNIVIKMIKNNK